ncbi:hypothetical protein J3A83DRAFT_4212429 [Scleroderma citrinum]
MHIVSGSRDQTIQVWNAQTGGQMVNTVPGHAHSVNLAVSFPGGGHIEVDPSITVYTHSNSATFLEANAPPFMPPGVHNTESVGGKSNLRSYHRHLRYDLYQENDSWIVGSNGQRVLWVPPSYQYSSYLWPPCSLVIEDKYLISFWNMAHGSTWHQCYCPLTDRL